jgi:hypothetical protein
VTCSTCRHNGICHAVDACADVAPTAIQIHAPITGPRGEPYRVAARPQPTAPAHGAWFVVATAVACIGACGLISMVAGARGWF